MALMIELITFVILPSVIFAQVVNAAVVLNGSTAIAKTDEHYICATLDWWPPEKCNYNQCPWGRSSILNLDLDNTSLIKAVQEFSHLRIRLGGSLQDQVIYGVPTTDNSLCPEFDKVQNGLFGFSNGCLSMERWDKLNNLFEKTGVIVTFGLNALYGRYNLSHHVWGGPWNSTNARDFIEYTMSKGYHVDSWEYGNELSGHGIGARVHADTYGKDIVGLKYIIENIYRNKLSKPLLLAPGGFFDLAWYSEVLKTSGPHAIDALTHHIYNLGGGDDIHLARKILDPLYLDQVADIYKSVQETIRKYGQWASAWVSEGGGVSNNGRHLVSNTFINSIWYLDQLGMASKYKTKVYCRQTLVGGNYGLLDVESFLPNPDYYSALLWSRLMGKKVLAVHMNEPPSLRAYAHCSKQKEGITLLLINLSNSSAISTTVKNSININLMSKARRKRPNSFVHALKRAVSWLGTNTPQRTSMREEYHLTAPNGNHESKIMLLNGIALKLTNRGDIPALNPVFAAVDSPVTLAPLSIAFVVLPKYEAAACNIDS